MEELKDKYIMLGIVPLDSKTEYFANFLCLVDTPAAVYSQKLRLIRAIPPLFIDPKSYIANIISFFEPQKNLSQNNTKHRILAEIISTLLIHKTPCGAEVVGLGNVELREGLNQIAPGLVPLELGVEII